MAATRDTDVLVVGAGPVGLFTALCLAERGVQVEVIDEEWRTAAHSYALALHPASLDLLAGLDLLDPLLDRSRRVTEVVFHDGADRIGAVDLQATSPDHPFLCVLPQSALEGALEDRLRERGVRIGWNHSLSALEPAPDRVAVTVDRLGKSSRGYAVATTDWVIEGQADRVAGFVVGADGHRSAVRRHLGIEFEKAGDPDLYAVFEFTTDFDPGTTARVAFAGDTVNVLWPLPGGRVRASFLLPEGAEEHEARTKSRLAVQVGGRDFPHLDEESLGRFLDERMPWFEGGADLVAWALEVRFDRRLAASFGRGRVWLAGDAAHLAGPVGVQSMNVGLLEGHDLAERIAAALEGGADPDLSGYGDTWSAEWRRLLGLAGPLAAGDDAPDWVRGREDLLPGLLPASGAQLDALLAGLGLSR